MQRFAKIFIFCAFCKLCSLEHNTIGNQFAEYGSFQWDLGCAHCKSHFYCSILLLISGVQVPYSAVWIGKAKFDVLEWFFRLMINKQRKLSDQKILEEAMIHFTSPHQKPAQPCPAQPEIILARPNKKKSAPAGNDAKSYRVFTAKWDNVFKINFWHIKWLSQIIHWPTKFMGAILLTVQLP